MAIETGNLVAEFSSRFAYNGVSPGNNTYPVGTIKDLAGANDGTLTNFGYALGDRPRTNSETDKAVWHDQSYLGYDGALQTFGFTTSSGWAGTGTTEDPYRLVFDGSSDYVLGPDLGASTAEDGSYTYEVWFMTTNATTNMNVLLGEHDSSPDSALVYVYSGDVWASTVSEGSVWSDVHHNTDVADGQLHHAVFGCGSSLMNLYVDGVDSGSSPAPQLTPTVDKVVIGGLKGSYLDGSILTARVYMTKLTEAQAQQNYAAGPNGAGYYKTSNCILDLRAANAVRSSGWSG